MLKYVALLKIDEPARWSEWHSGPTDHRFRSPFYEEKVMAEKWLQDQLAKVPDSTVNTGECDKKYIIYTSIIAYEFTESENVESYLGKTCYDTSMFDSLYNRKPLS